MTVTTRWPNARYTATVDLAPRTLQERERSPELLIEIDTDLAMLDELRARATAIIPC